MCFGSRNGTKQPMLPYRCQPPTYLPTPISGPRSVSTKKWMRIVRWAGHPNQATIKPLPGWKVLCSTDCLTAKAAGGDGLVGSTPSQPRAPCRVPNSGMCTVRGFGLHWALAAKGGPMVWCVLGILGPGWAFVCCSGRAGPIQDTMSPQKKIGCDCDLTQKNMKHHSACTELNIA